MGEIDWFAWRTIIGLACGFLGLLIFWVGGLPRQLKRGDQPTAEKGTPEAFGLFWMDQYGYLGLGLMLGGAIMVGISLIQCLGSG